MKVSRILQMSDLHLGVEETIPSVNPSIFLAEFLAEVVERRIAVDCCIVTGDLAHGGEPAGYERLRRLLNSCPWPTRVLPGNHDDLQMGREILGSTYWPAEDTWTWEIEGGSTIVGINSVLSGFHHGEVPEASLRNLEQQVRSMSAGRPWVLALHHPPHDIGHWWMDAEGLLAGRGRVLEIADANRAAAVLCGHVHMNAVVHRTGRVPIIVAPSLVHEVVYDDGPERPLRFRRRSPRALIHYLGDDNLTTVELTSGGISWLVEGKPWKNEVDRSNRRLPAQH